MRINAQLIEAATGHHLWAERYDGNSSDIFALQDKITQKIAASLEVKLTQKEQALLAQRQTDNMEAYEAYLKISAENQLTGEKIRELFFGRKVTGFNMATAKQWWIERNQDGKATVRDGDNADTGKSWVEEDMLCDQWDNLYESLKDCWVVYRNPEGTPENNDEYLGAPGYGIYLFSQIE